MFEEIFKGREKVEQVTCTAPQREDLRGKHILLTPWTSEHPAKLYPKVSGPEGEKVWAYIPTERYESLENFHAGWKDNGETMDPLFWAAIDLRTDECVGWGALGEISVEHRIIESGMLLAPEMQRTTASTEVWYLMAKKSFDELGFRKMEWRCDSGNSASRGAAERFGHSLDGIIRQDKILKGYNRDTCVYTILDKEWPLQKAAMEKWMDDSNFDGDGRQKKSLAAIKKELGSSQ